MIDLLNEDLNTRMYEKIEKIVEGEGLDLGPSYDHFNVVSDHKGSPWIDIYIDLSNFIVHEPKMRVYTSWRTFTDNVQKKLDTIRVKILKIEEVKTISDPYIWHVSREGQEIAVGLNIEFYTMPFLCMKKLGLNISKLDLDNLNRWAEKGDSK